MRDEADQGVGADTTGRVTVAATVTGVEIDPELRDPVRRHLVRLRVDRTLVGDPPGDRLTVLMHSPSRAFADPDPVGSTYLVTLTPPLSEPYLGPLEIADPEP